MNKIKIKYFTDIDKIESIEIGNWIDLRAADDVVLERNKFQLIPLGVAMELPQGYEAHVVPRSSSFKNWGILQTNGMGVIDCSYNGDNDQWFMPVYPTRDITISKNERICQFRVVESMSPVEFVEVGELGNKDRGGHGSTGLSDIVKKVKE